jgi:hypothetical protein
MDPSHVPNHHISRICTRSRPKTTQEGSDTTIGKRVGYSSMQLPCHSGNLQVEDHGSLPLDAQRIGRRVGAAGPM